MPNDQGMSNDDSGDAADLAFWFGDSSVVREEPDVSPNMILKSEPPVLERL